MKSTIQILHDRGPFKIYENRDEVLKDFFLVERHRPDLEEVNDEMMIMSLNDFIYKRGLKNTPTSNIKEQQILSSLSVNDVKIYLKLGPLSGNIGIVNLHPPKGTHWVVYIIILKVCIHKFLCQFFLLTSKYTIYIIY